MAPVPEKRSAFRPSSTRAKVFMVNIEDTEEQKKIVDPIKEEAPKTEAKRVPFNRNSSKTARPPTAISKPTPIDVADTKDKRDPSPHNKGKSSPKSQLKGIPRVPTAHTPSIGAGKVAFIKEVKPPQKKFGQGDSSWTTFDIGAIPSLAEKASKKSSKAPTSRES